MPYLIDRRLNPRDKSLGNRQRFLRRTREQIKKAVDKAINDQNVADVGDDGKISIPTRGIREPRFRHDGEAGRRQRVLPGNREFVPGDRIPKPASGGGEGSGKEASDHGEGEDEFVFALSRDEFLDLFFEDLELPDLVKATLKETYAYKPYRAGFTGSGTPANLNVLRTMRNSIGRRLALRRPVRARVEALEAELAELRGRDDLDAQERRRMAELSAEIEALERRRRAVPYIDPVDLRYNRFEQQPQPRTKAVMFCLMDVSGSMGQHEKDLAKRFFILLHLFLQRRYERVEIVFIRHTHQAQEVDEETFFYSQESGGTVVSTALIEMRDVVRARYPVAEWNIYAAQASDGDNFSNDTERCVAMLASELLPICQYYAYVEILDQREFDLFKASNNGKELWRSYRMLQESWPNFSMKHIAERSHIYPVFRELFAKTNA
jgi:uncharacterized sporulation protein YeaH/YhbH (DUF444 family)